MTKENDVFRETLNKIIQEIDIILNDFDESKSNEIMQKTIDIIKLTKLCVLSIKIEAFFLDISLTNILTLFWLDSEEKEYILKELYYIREDLGGYSKEMNNIKYEIKKLYDKAELTFILRRINIIAKLTCGKYNLFVDIKNKLKTDDEELVKKNKFRSKI